MQKVADSSKHSASNLGGELLQKIWWLVLILIRGQWPTKQQISKSTPIDAKFILAHSMAKANECLYKVFSVHL